MRINPDSLAKRLLQQLMQERMIPFELQITPREAGVVGELVGRDMGVTCHRAAPDRRLTLRDLVYD